MWRRAVSDELFPFFSCWILSPNLPFRQSPVRFFISLGQFYQFAVHQQFKSSPQPTPSTSIHSFNVRAKRRSYNLASRVCVCTSARENPNLASNSVQVQEKISKCRVSYKVVPPSYKMAYNHSKYRYCRPTIIVKLELFAPTWLNMGPHPVDT
jgi:hypothetical protein